MPSGGDGLYYLSVYLTTQSSENAYFDLEIHGERLCSVFADLNNANSGDVWGTSCSGVADVMEGNLWLSIIITQSNYFL